MTQEAVLSLCQAGHPNQDTPSGLVRGELEKSNYKWITPGDEERSEY